MKAMIWVMYSPTYESSPSRQWEGFAYGHCHIEGNVESQLLQKEGEEFEPSINNNLLSTSASTPYIPQY